jgi:hypothetical protein
MPSAIKCADSRKSGSGANLLHGSDLPKKQMQQQLKIVSAREAPANFSSPMILDIEEVIPGKTGLALNATNTRIMAELIGDNFFEWPGALITVAKVPQRNPKTGEQTWGLIVTEARKYRGRQAAAAATPKKGKGKKVAAVTEKHIRPDLETYDII